MQISPLYQKAERVCERTLEKRNLQLSVCLDLDTFARSLNFVDTDSFTKLWNQGGVLKYGSYAPFLLPS